MVGKIGAKKANTNIALTTMKRPLLISLTLYII